jgi:7,8-dihydropterin-6-yl-methyl-4-(beta-D-ribofuranosyl)aminobenzene 5'-phosphate synthase
VVARTVEAFQLIQPDFVAPMHCTGFYSAAMIEHALPRHVVESSSGTRFTFGS